MVLQKDVTAAKLAGFTRGWRVQSSILENLDPIGERDLSPFAAHFAGVDAILQEIIRQKGVLPHSGLRWVVPLDGEFAPAGIAGLGKIDDQSQPPPLPRAPVSTSGISPGVEAPVR
jgi:hypothetical protein